MTWTPSGYGPGFVWTDLGTGHRMILEGMGVSYSASTKLHDLITQIDMGVTQVTAIFDCGCEWMMLDTWQRNDVPDDCPLHDPARLAPGGLITGPLTFSFSGSLLGSFDPATYQAVLGAPAEEKKPARELELSFQTECITGWRAWKVNDFERHGGIIEPRLQSLTGRDSWAPRERCEARCSPARMTHYSAPGAAHEAPWPSCDCGIWAVRDRDLIPVEGVRRNYGGLLCVGEVSLWGRVLEFERGWRAMYAYPASLTLLADDSETAAELERLYGVPVACGPLNEKKTDLYADVHAMAAYLKAVAADRTAASPVLPRVHAPGWTYEPVTGSGPTTP